MDAARPTSPHPRDFGFTTTCRCAFCASEYPCANAIERWKRTRPHEYAAYYDADEQHELRAQETDCKNDTARPKPPHPRDFGFTTTCRCVFCASEYPCTNAIERWKRTRPHEYAAYYDADEQHEQLWDTD